VPELDVSFERIVKSGSEDVDLMVLGQSLATAKEGEKLALVVGDEARAPQLDQLTQSIAPERWPKSLIDQPDEVIARRSALVMLQQGIPLHCVACHIEGCKEHFADGWHLLNAE
jgi:hypothetical protein